MKSILILDTCGPVGSLALQVQGHAYTAEMEGRTFAQRLIPEIEGLLKQAGMKLGELDGVVVVNGPGSFTGVRVGIAAAKGLADAVGLQLAGVSRLRVLRALAPHGTHFALDAGRGEFYLGSGVEDWRESLATKEELAGQLGEGTRLVVCEARVLESLMAFNPIWVASPRAEDVLLFNVEELPFKLDQLDAYYLRRTGADIFAKPTPAASGR